MYICDNCGDLIAELPSELFPHTELDGNPCEILETLDCRCCGTYVRASQCDCCDEWIAEDELQNGWCKHCIKEFTVPHMILKYVDHSAELQRRFYIDAQFDYWSNNADDAPHSLLQLCKQRFDQLLSISHLHPTLRTSIDRVLLEFIEADMDEFEEWLTMTQKPLPWGFIPLQ